MASSAPNRPTRPALHPLLSSRFSRRSFLTYGAGALLIPGALAACGSSGGSSADSTPGTDGAGSTAAGSGEKGTVRFINWPAYIDEGQKTLREFEAATGYKVDYREDFNDNDEWYAIAAPKFENGRDIGADLVCPTGWMCGRVIKAGWAATIDDASVPNKKNVVANLVDVAWDPGHGYTLPWAQIRAGIAYDPEKTGFEITSIEDLFKPEMKGKVTFLTEMRDTMGLMMLLGGDDPSKPTDAAFQKALKRVQEAKDSGQVYRFTGNDYLTDLATGDAAACLAWGGDIISARKDNPNLQFVYPAEGHMLNVDNMLIPSTAENVDGARAIMNWYYDPKNAALWMATSGYRSSVIGVEKELEAIAPDVLKEPIMFPGETIDAQAKVWAEQDDALNEAWTKAYQGVTTG
jgi:spermidine/putrescine transport system substrate-binding protein